MDNRMLLAVVCGFLALIGVGIYSENYFSVTLFLSWVGFEVWYRRRPAKVASERPGLAALAALLPRLGRSDARSETLLNEKIARIRLDGPLTQHEMRWIERVKDLSLLRSLVFGNPLVGRQAFRQGFAFSAKQRENALSALPAMDSLQDVTSAAMVVAELYWKLFESATGEYRDLQPIAIKLYEEIFDLKFDPAEAQENLTRLTDAMQREGGMPFLVLNLIHQGKIEAAKAAALWLLTHGGEIDEDVRSAVYWMAEIHWFTQPGFKAVQDHESTLRHLYHLCFTNPDRAGFLEIDSPFFSEFDSVSELAREGMLFKEPLFEKLSNLWETYDGFFNPVFQGVLGHLTGRQNKIYDARQSWQAWWNREGENFSRDYLHVVEGNLSYASGLYADAATQYQAALALNPDLRSARLNLVFALARLGKEAAHREAVDMVLADPNLMPSGWYVAGNSYLLLGKVEQAERYYESLKQVPGWDAKAEFYKSSFCFENGLFREALAYALKAHRSNPVDTSLRYHLSLCYNAVGEKERALEMLGQGSEGPQWMSYYRFTLQRDAGKADEASKTLLTIPPDYFDDEEELDAAVAFARGQENLALLRHLRRR